MQHIRDALPLSGVSIQLMCASCLYRLILKNCSLSVSLFVFSRLKIFQTSALHLPVMPEVRCAARTKRATSSVTVLRAGPEPDVRKVMSSLWKVREVIRIVGHCVLELSRGQIFALSFTSSVCGQTDSHIINVTLVLTGDSFPIH